MSGNTSPIIGIDLGTSNSAVAWFAEGDTQLITGAQGERLTPSVIGMMMGGTCWLAPQLKRVWSAIHR